MVFTRMRYPHQILTALRYKNNGFLCHIRSCASNWLSVCFRWASSTNSIGSTHEALGPKETIGFCSVAWRYKSNGFSCHISSCQITMVFTRMRYPHQILTALRYKNNGFLCHIRSCASNGLSVCFRWASSTNSIGSTHEA